MKREYLKDISNTKKEITEIAKWIKNGNSFDSKTMYLIAYSVIKVSGTIEVIYKKIIYDHLIKNANTENEYYLDNMIVKSSSNPNTGNIGKLLEKVSSSWKTEFDDKTKGTPEKDDLNRLVRYRNNFAHGEKITATIDDVTRCYDSGVIILRILDKIVA